jgi:predicted RNA-binding Zn-ribbon protein involved in translation (DUF1610 family)
MTNPPERSDDTDEPQADTELTPQEVYEEMKPFEPYTTGELASKLGLPKRLLRKFLNPLTDDEKVRKKETESSPVIWIREPPTNSCPNCGREFQIRFLHPVFSSAHVCPRCGTQLD